MADLPPLSFIITPNPPDSTAALSSALSTLFEPSPILLSKLVPALSASPLLHALPTYAAFIDLALSTLSTWDTTSQAAFLAAHPRIGEVANLSLLSQQEQAAKATPAPVLVRLAQLNAMYEERYPGLRYITFVNGRSRTEILVEMEDKLGDGTGESCEVGGAEWCAELVRALEDAGRIAKSRARALGVG